MSLSHTHVELMHNRRRWPDDITVWLIDALLDEHSLRAFLSQLPDDERERAARFHKHEDRSRFAVTRACLRSILAERVGISSRGITFDIGANGRPSLNGLPGVSFNVTHAGSFAMIALSAKRTVGIDIERLDAVADWKFLAEHVCSRQEIATIESALPDRRSALFMRCWTAKEALLKTSGLGIGNMLKDVVIHPTKEGSQRPCVAGPLSGDIGNLTFHWLDDVPQYSACVSYSGS